MGAGRRIGKYVLDERIAVGGMAEVWAAHAEGREGFVKPVALKLILESFSGDPELERLFVNEARIAARLQHANLVTVFDFDKVDAEAERGLAGRYYIAMERVEGHDLRRIAEAARRAGVVFPVGVVLHVAGEMLKALRYVHERRDEGGALGLVHRDVSPHNVLVGAAGEVKLSDFGIAKAREHSARTTKPGSLRGKVSYASPEQLGGGPVDHRTDQFAAGVTIWELLAGRRLFDGATELEILAKVARCEIPALAAAGGRRDVPAAVEGVLRRMLAAEPARRFPTTAEALSAVLALEGYSPDGAPLGELMRSLFRPQALGLAQTVPLREALTPRRADSPTRTMDGGVSAARGGSVSTVEVRAGRRLGRVVALVAAAVALGGAWTARRPHPGVEGRPPATAAAVVKRAPPEALAAAPAPPVVPRPAITSPAPMPTPTPTPTLATQGARRRGSRRGRAAASDAPVVAPPAPMAAPPVKASANGAPILE